jgi:hypothetical protein
MHEKNEMYERRERERERKKERTSKREKERENEKGRVATHVLSLFLFPAFIPSHSIPTLNVASITLLTTYTSVQVEIG